jgi:glycosyltransferase involved in cell wall biosynthesis
LAVSIVIPVLNGAEYLPEIFAAIAAQQLDEPIETLVIDSGSTDGSVGIARDADVRVMEIAKSEFQHGRTRNLGISETSGRLIAFLTQDATPSSPEWLAAYVAVFDADDRVGAAYGPHIPRPGANPFMARLLTEFFGEMATDGGVTIHEGTDIPYLSNSNSCVRRALWEEIPFRELPYAEDQALGADLLAAGWKKAYVPGAGALHSHDYTLWESCRRWFDDYRGMRDSVGEVHTVQNRSVTAIIRRGVSADRAWLRDQLGMRGARLALWTARSFVWHFCRVLFGGLGSHAERLPGPVTRWLSLEGRAGGITET